MGFPWKAFGQIAEKIGPAILEHYGVPTVLVPLVIKSVVAVEQAITSGADKKTVVMETVKTGIEVTNQVTGKSIDVSAVDAVSAGVDAVVRAVNAVKK